MDELLNISEEAIIRYFTTLSQFGFKQYTDVERIMILFFIEEMLTHEFADFITEKDYRDIVNALYCLYGSTCMIEFPSFETIDSLVHSTNRDYTPRVTEDDALRGTQEGILRVEV